MPLLKKKTLEKAPLPEFLRDDEEVFHCEMTNEIFRDYDEFAERTILCNSMVWTCSMTGKSNLTYVEALQSEENARKSLRDFPMELQKAVLFLATKTQRTSFGDMAEDVFFYMKDRYFVGERVDPPFTGQKYKDYKVVQVIAPSEDQVKKTGKNSNPTDRIFYPPATLYKYSVEAQDADDQDISETMIVDCSRIRRRKGVYSRDKNKLLLKQHVEQSSEGYWLIKKSSVEEFDLNELQFEQIFDGPLPAFEKSKKKVDKKGSMVNGKKVRQETLAKFLSKDNKTETGGEKKKNNLLEQMKKKEQAYKEMKEQLKLKKAEEKLAEKQKKREENILISNLLKEWMKPKEDLYLEDQKKLPVPIPVQCKIPDKYLGDVMMVLEFVHSFSKILHTKDFFPGDFTLDLMERALMEREVAGPLTDLIQMLLSALFSVQELETAQYRTNVENSRDIKEDEVIDNLSLVKATHYATAASSWCTKHQGLPLSRLPLYSLTVTEILRLHLLTSGARIVENGSKWRYAQRGGYTSEDDPGLYFRLHEPHILKALASYNIVQLPISYKLKIVSCLINQLLTYADVRDVVEEKLETHRQAKMDFRTLQAAERRRHSEFITAKWKLKKDETVTNREEELQKLQKSANSKQADCERKLKEYLKVSYENIVALGSDRAYRRYLKLESVPGLFINDEEEHPGICHSEIVPQIQELVSGGRNETIEYLRKINEELNTSDKENNPNKESTDNKESKDKNDPKDSKSPKDLKSPKEPKVNGLKNSTVTESSINKESPIKASTIKESTIKESPIKGSTIKESPIKGSPIKESSIKESTIKESTIKESTIKDSIIKDSTIKDSTIKDSTIKSSTITKESALTAEEEQCKEILMCSADPSTCVVHSTAASKPRWSFYNDPHQVEELLGTLNKRGIRESDLLQTLEGVQESITKLVLSAPSSQLNPSIPLPETDSLRPRLIKKGKNKYEDANLGFSTETDPSEVSHTTLVDIILEMEEKIYAGTLGTIQVKDRFAWRENLHARKYDDLDKTYVKHENGVLPSLEKIKVEGKNGSRPETPDSGIEEKVKAYCDPGKYLGLTLEVEAGNSEEEGGVLEQSEEMQKAIQSLAIALVQVSQGIEARFMKKPLGSADFKPKRDDRKKEAHSILHSWQESLLAATSFSQIFLHYGTLDSCIMWSKSALLAKCRICRRQKDSENMLLCDSCNMGHHLYCLKPKLKAVPVGDWFCPRCVQEKEAEAKLRSPEPPAKKRRIFRDEDVEEEEEEKKNGEGEQEESDVEDSSEEDEINESQEAPSSQENGDETMKIDTCSNCEATGDLLYCDKCPKAYHLDCINPPLRRAPRGKWTCHKCTEKDKKSYKDGNTSSTNSGDELYVYGAVARRTGVTNNQRRCAARARHKIHVFAKSLRGSGYSDDSESEAEVTNHRRSNRRDVDGRDDLPLHNAALQELLSDVMKHKDAWPFIRPVQKTEVPDYYEVISRPMDFGTIKYKLNMGNYTCDADLMADSVLVFENCNTYNNSDALVYKCGVRLLKHFQKKAKELGLKVPEEMQSDNEEATSDAPKTKKRRTK